MILGAGPAGLSAADYLVNIGKNVAIIDRGTSTNAYYSATGKYELIKGMQAGGIGGATHQWGGQLLRLGKSEYLNWAKCDDFKLEIFADLENETDAILKKFKTRVPKFNGSSVGSCANLSSVSSRIPKEKRLTHIFRTTINSPYFHYIEGLEISSIEKINEEVVLKTNSTLNIHLDNKILLLALGTVENTALLVRSVPHFTNQVFYKIGRNLQDHPHGVIFQVESGLLNWYRNYFFLGLNNHNQKRKFEYTQMCGDYIRGGVSEIHPIDPGITFKDELKAAYTARSFVSFMKLVLRVVSTMSIRTFGKKLYFDRADVWFQYEQKDNENSYLDVSKNKILFKWSNSKDDYDFLLSASVKLQDFYRNMGFKVTNVRSFMSLEELDAWCSEACHPSGTIPLNSDESLGVADFFGKVHAIPKTYLLGSSLFPTSGWLNPTLLIMAYSRLVVSRTRANSEN